MYNKYVKLFYGNFVIWDISWKHLKVRNFFVIIWFNVCVAPNFFCGNGLQWKCWSVIYVPTRQRLPILRNISQLICWYLKKYIFANKAASIHSKKFFQYNFIPRHFKRYCWIPKICGAGFPDKVWSTVNLLEFAAIST